MDWTQTRVAPSGTHHLGPDGRPLYAARFEAVLKFHAPGLAPVRAADGAFHIGLDGGAAYPQRHARTFGFYEGRAAVDGGEVWWHIRPDGRPLYPERYAWCGNAQGGRMTVRDPGGRYLHLDLDGRVVSPRRWRYAGDYRGGLAVVQDDRGLHTHVDRAGQITHGRWFQDLDVFHKGRARARDAGGWMHVDATGAPCYGRRFAQVEPFYNGQARVERFDGGLEVIDEAGHTLHELRPARVTPLQRLSSDMVGFWRTQAIRAGVALGVFEGLPGTTAALSARVDVSEALTERLLRGLWELGLVRRDGARWVPTARGALLTGPREQGAAAAAVMWGAEHYAAWQALPGALRMGESGFQRRFGAAFFPWLARRPAALAQFQSAMAVYAAEDYADLPLDAAGAEVVIDAGGGRGALLAGILRAWPSARGVLLELPQVVAGLEIPPDLNPRMQAVGADLTLPWPVEGDLIVLARVLHDWPEPMAASILGNARQALRPGGRVVLVERVLDPDTPDGALLDLNMFVMCGARERTLADWRALAVEAGLTLRSASPLRFGAWALELSP
ncbi:MAG: methyltransferase [Alphaproteobacteria bacterium]|nr:methyltransferase [Alphaproteobacteria bacterium]